MSLCVETCAIQGCDKPIFDYIYVPDHSGNLAGFCVAHYELGPLYYDKLSCKWATTPIRNAARG